MKSIVWTILRISRTLNRYAVEILKLPVNQCYSLDILSWRIVEAFIRIAAPQRRAARHLAYTWYIGKRFLHIQMRFHQHRSIHPQWRRVEDQNKIKIWDARLHRQPKIQSSSVEETLQRIMGQTNHYCRFRISILTSSLCQQPLLAASQDRGMYLFTISYGNDAMDQGSGVGWFSGWIEIFLIYRGISMPNFEVLNARIASALNKIIHNSQFKRRISLEEQKAQKEDRFLRGRQIAYLIYEQFRVTGTDDSVENYTDLFTIVHRNDDIQEFDSKWDGILLSMTKIPHDDILECLYKLRIRESEKLKTVLELYDLETHQKKLGPDNQKLKNMVKRSIEQEIRNKNFGNRIGNIEKNAVVKNQGTKQRVQRILGDCWQWETNGQCAKEDTCSFRHDINKRGKSSTSNPSPNSCMRQKERKPSRTRSPRGKKPQW